MKHISILTPCYNEEDNVEAICEAVRGVFDRVKDRYTYEHLFIDNASKDRTVEILRGICKRDANVRVIVNSRNFGHVRSPYHGTFQTTGDAVIGLVCDFQDPPEMILEFLAKWEEGYKMVLAVKEGSDESPLLFAIRSAYYRMVRKLADVELTENATGFGLYDRQVIEVLRSLNEPYPYFRGLIADIGFEACKIPYHQPRRKRGITKNNFYSLYDLAMLGVTNHSKVPLRIATMAGFVMSAVSLIFAIGYFAAKLLFWDWFTVGIAPMLISLFFFSSVQLFFIGILGEYIGAIHTYVQRRPHVIERERINFDVPARLPEANGHAVAPGSTRPAGTA
jgi:glycosyltransferase involved in cell wall biosynthesis